MSLSDDILAYHKTCRAICDGCQETCLVRRKPCKSGRVDLGYFCKASRWPRPEHPALARAWESLREFFAQI